MTTTTDNFADLTAGIEFSAKLVGDDFVKPDDLGNRINRNGQSHWEVCIGSGRCELRTEYHQGSAYREWSQSINSPPVRVVKGERVNLNVRITLWMEGLLLERTVPTVPNLKNVLYCLAMDAQSVECSTFEDWCAEMGYDEDSRKAEKMYRACCDTRARLAAFFKLSDLYEYYEGY